LIAAAKFLVAATKKLFVVPNFVTVTKPFFSVQSYVKRIEVRGNLFSLDIPDEIVKCFDGNSQRVLSINPYSLTAFFFTGN